MRLAVSLGGDFDTLTDIARSITESYHPISKNTKEKAMEFLDTDLLKIL